MLSSMMGKFGSLLLLLSCSAEALRMRKSVGSANMSFSGEPFWDKYGDGVMQGLGVVADSIVGEDDTLKDAGTFLKNTGKFVGTVVPPPHGILLGSVFSMFGGAIGLKKKKPTGPRPPSNQDILNALGKGLGQIGRRLDGLDRKVDDILKTVKYVKQTTIKTLDIAGKHFESYLLKPIKKVHAVFQDAMEKLGEALRDSQNDRSFQHFLDKVELWAKANSHITFEKFSVDNVERTVAEVVNIKTGGIGAGAYRCVAAEVYRDIVAARFELFWILYMGTAFQPGLAGQSLLYAKQLHEQMADYQRVVVPKFHLDGRLMSASLSQLKIATKHRYKVKLPADAGLERFQPLTAEVSEVLTARHGVWPWVHGRYGPGVDSLYVIGKDLNKYLSGRPCKVRNHPRFQWADNKLDMGGECRPVIAKSWADSRRDCACTWLFQDGRKPDICVIGAEWVESTCFAAVVEPEDDPASCKSLIDGGCDPLGWFCGTSCCSGHCHREPSELLGKCVKR